VHTGGMDFENREWLQGRIDGRIAAGIGVAWLAAYQLAVSLEPVTHKPEPWYGIVLNLAFMGLLAAMVAGLVMQRRWGLVVSLAAAAFFTALSVACPVSGHHPFGPWWFGQMACALGMVGASLAAVSWSTRSDRSTAPADTPTDTTSNDESARLNAGDAASRG
jgi:MFS family permease